MAKQQYAVIGLGRFGSSVARELSDLGFEVLVVDVSEQRIQEMSQWVTYAVTVDSTDEESLRSLGLHNFDVVVVAIGEDIQASILTTLILKEQGVPKLIVKAQNELHGKVLEKIGADKVIFPERDMGVRVAHRLISPNIQDYTELSDDYSIVEIVAPSVVIGRTLIQLDIRASFKCSVLAIKRGKDMDFIPAVDDLIKKDDILVLVGKTEDLTKLELAYAEG